MKLNKNTIRELAEYCSMMEVESEIFEANIEDLGKFAEKVIEIYESNEQDDTYTSYGKSEDWE